MLYKLFQFLFKGPSYRVEPQTLILKHHSMWRRHLQFRGIHVYTLKENR
jgi:hypothetical protein